MESRSYHSSLSLLAVFVLFASGTALVSTQAHADGMSLSVGTDLSLATVPGTSLSSRVGYRLGQITPFAGVDYARLSATAEGQSRGGYEFDPETGDYVEVPPGPTEEELSGSLLTLQLGARYDLSPPEAGKVNPYVVGALFTVIPSTDGAGAVDDVVSDVSSFGLMAGFGGAYNFAKSFSIGGELGANYFALAYDKSPNKLDLSTLEIYSTVNLTFVFE